MESRFVLEDKDVIVLGEDEKVKNGGKGSGNFGHSGRPGEVGGSGNGSSVNLSKEERSKVIQEIKDFIGSEKDNKQYMWKDACQTGEFKEYLDKSCDEFLASLKDELNQAKEDGIDFQNIFFGFTSDKGVLARTSYSGESIVLKFKKDLMKNGSDVIHAEDNWFTDSTARGIIAHELGHIKIAQEALKVGLDLSENNRTCYEYTLMKEIYPNLTPFEMKNILKETRNMSRYGSESISEAFAESWSNPNYSEMTRKINAKMRNGIESNERKKELSLLTGVQINAIEKRGNLCIGLTTDKEILKSLLSGKEWVEEIKKINKSLNNKIINGGPGSGNFGHLGRPGEIGGSSNIGTIISPMRTKAFMNGDIVELTLDDGSKIQGEFVMSAKTPAGKLMSAKDENGKIHTVPFTSSRVKMIKNYDAPDTKPSERRTKTQKEALGEVFNILTVDERMQRYMLNNCGEDTAVALKDELKKAQEDGVDFSNVRLTQGNLGRNRAQVRTEIHSGYDGERTNYKADVQLMLSSGLVAGGKNYEASLKRQYEKGETLTPDIASVFRHEIGHIRANDLVARMTNNNYNSNDYNRLNRLITDKALNATGKTFGDVPHLVSEYGATDRSEMFAESFAQPNHSELTKAVVKAYKEFGPENWQRLTLNKNEQILKSFDLCTGIPPEQKEEFIPDEGER